MTYKDYYCVDGEMIAAFDKTSAAAFLAASQEIPAYGGIKNAQGDAVVVNGESGTVENILKLDLKSGDKVTLCGSNRGETKNKDTAEFLKRYLVQHGLVK